MRKLALTAAAGALLATAVAPVALAGPETVDLKVKPASTKAGTAKKARANGLHVTISAGPAGDYAAKRTIVSLDKNFKFNPKKFPTCAEDVVQSDPASCPSASKVGKGTAEAVVARLNNLKSNLTVTAFNGPKNKLFLRVETTKPIVVQGVIVGTLKKAKGKYGHKLDVVIPDSLTNIAGATPTLTEFITNIKKTYKGVPYMETKGCSGGKWNFAVELSYTDGTKGKDTASVKCKK